MGSSAESEIATFVELLGQVDLFKGVDAADLANLSRAIETAHFTDGQMIFDQGDEGHNVLVIKSGVVRIITINGDRTKQISTCFDGDLVGELALLDEKPRSARAVASGPVEALVISRVTFLDFLLARPPMMLALLEALTTRARRLSDLVEGNIEWLGNLANGHFGDASGFALSLAPAMFKVGTTRPLIRSAALARSAATPQAANPLAGGLFSRASHTLNTRERPDSDKSA